jgi:hypothetical protein
MAEARERLLRNQNLLQAFVNFEDLFDFVHSLIGSIPGIGELAEYDISQRIGVALNLRPRMVYLHRGAADGFRNLGLKQSGKRRVELQSLPRAFHRLTPEEVEDCLCRYKSVISGEEQLPSSCTTSQSTCGE